MNEIQLYIAVVIPTAAVLLAVPISFVPIQWARALGWPVSREPVSSDERNLSLYFARCLGALAIAFCVACALAGLQDEVPQPIMIQSILIGAGLTLVHAYGALRHAQPMIETIETAIYAAITIWGISLYFRFY